MAMWAFFQCFMLRQHFLVIEKQLSRFTKGQPYFHKRLSRVFRVFVPWSSKQACEFAGEGQIADSNGLL